MDPRNIDDRIDMVFPGLDEVNRLKREVEGWKAASKREGASGFVLGAIIFFVIGYLAASFSK